MSGALNWDYRVSTRGEFYQLVVYSISFVALAFALPLMYLTQPVHFDEAIWLVIGDQMTQGKTLYGDVYDHKPPGIFYLALAGERFVATFGQQLQFLTYGNHATEAGLVVYVLRLLTYGAVAVSGLLVYILGREIHDQTTGMGASLVFLVGVYLPHFVGFYFLTEQWAILTTIVAAILLLDDRVSSDVLAGFALGIGVLFNQTVFLFGLAFIVFRAAQLRYSYNRSRSYLRTTLRRFGAIGVGFTVPVVAVLAIFYNRGLLPELLYYTVYLPLFTYSPPMTVGGRILALLSFFPVWLVTFGVLAKIGMSFLRDHHLENPLSRPHDLLYEDGGSPFNQAGILFIALWAIFVSFPGATGFDAQHQLLFVFPPVAILAVIGMRWLLDATWQHLSREYSSPNSATAWSRSIPALGIAVLSVSLVISAGVNGAYAANTIDSQHDQIAQAKAVDERVDGVTYTWPPQQNHLYYFSEDLEPAPTYFMTVYGEAVSDQVIRDIEQSEVEYVVVRSSHVTDDGEIDPASSKWFGDEKADLTTYLNRHYEPVDQTEDYTVFALASRQ